MTRLQQIQSLRATRDKYARLGKRGKVSILEAQMRGLILRELYAARPTIDNQMHMHGSDGHAV